MTNPIKTKQEIISEKIEEFKELFGFAYDISKEAVITEVSYVTIDKLTDFLSQSINSAIDETIEAMKIYNTEFFFVGKKYQKGFNDGHQSAVDQQELQRKLFEGEV